jgi:hypothetical protein
MNNATETQQSVIAILKADNKLKAVELFKQNGSYKILWAKSSIENDLDWQAFADRCGLTTKITQHAKNTKDTKVAVGYDSAGTAFYRVNVPAVGEKEISAIVHMQAESRFPLAADQMELAWRTGKTDNNHTTINIASARKKLVQNFIDKVRGLRPAHAFLDSEAVVKIWKEFFSGYEHNAVIVNAGSHNTQICLATDGLLCNSVTLDMGTVDFGGEGESQEETETIERFVRDTKSVMDLFEVEKQADVPVIVLSDGDRIYETMAASLKSAGLNARSAVPSIKRLKSDSELDIKQMYEYRASIGLALMALDGRTDEFNLFSYLFKPFGEKIKKRWFFCPRVTGTIAAVMVLLFIMVSYAVFAAGSKVINDKINTLGTEAEIDSLVERQELLREIASQRADLLSLLTEINRSGQSSPTDKKPGTPPVSSGQSGIQLESFHFKKGQRVTITGQSQTKEQLENFEKSLLGNKDIKDVSITAQPNTKSPVGSNQGGSRGSANNMKPAAPQAIGPVSTGSSGGRGFTFNITFNYKNFTVSKKKK